MAVYSLERVNEARHGTENSRWITFSSGELDANIEVDECGIVHGSSLCGLT